MKSLRMKLPVLTCALLLYPVCVADFETSWNPDKHPWMLTKNAHQSHRMDNFGLSEFDFPVLNTPPAGSKDKMVLNEQDLTLGRSLRNPKNFLADAEMRNANEHLLTMSLRTACSFPRETVVCVKDTYPDAKVDYQPACTILHRCDSGSGCCVNPSHSCQSYTTERVTLHFRSSRGSGLEKLQFTNHTSCRCENKEDTPAHVELLSSKARKHIRASKQKLRQLFDYADRDSDPNREDDEEEEKADDATECPKCPLPFSKRLKNRICQCDCFENDSHCLRVKQGQAKLEIEQRRCVHRNKCQKPTCVHGRHYDVGVGKCKRNRSGDNDDDVVDDEDTPKRHNSSNEADVDDDEVDS